MSINSCCQGCHNHHMCLCRRLRCHTVLCLRLHLRRNRRRNRRRSRRQSLLWPVPASTLQRLLLGAAAQEPLPPYYNSEEETESPPSSSSRPAWWVLRGEPCGIHAHLCEGGLVAAETHLREYNEYVGRQHLASSWRPARNVEEMSLRDCAGFIEHLVL